MAYSLLFLLQGDLYLVKWENYPAYDCTWEPAAHIPDPDLALYKNPSIQQEVLQVYTDILSKKTSKKVGVFKHPKSSTEALLKVDNSVIFPNFNYCCILKVQPI